MVTGSKVKVKQQSMSIEIWRTVPEPLDFSQNLHEYTFHELSGHKLIRLSRSSVQRSRSQNVTFLGWGPLICSLSTSVCDSVMHSQASINPSHRSIGITGNRSDRRGWVTFHLPFQYPSGGLWRQKLRYHPGLEQSYLRQDISMDSSNGSWKHHDCLFIYTLEMLLLTYLLTYLLLIHHSLSILHLVVSNPPGRGSLE